MGDFNIHVDNEKYALGSAFIDILNSIGVRQHVSGPTHCRNHTLDLILSHGIDVQCWERYFGNVIGYRLQVTLLKM